MTSLLYFHLSSCVTLRIKFIYFTFYLHVEQNKNRYIKDSVGKAYGWVKY